MVVLDDLHDAQASARAGTAVPGALPRWVAIAGIVCMLAWFFGADTSTLVFSRDLSSENRWLLCVLRNLAILAACASLMVPFGRGAAFRSSSKAVIALVCAFSVSLIVFLQDSALMNHGAVFCFGNVAAFFASAVFFLLWADLEYRIALADAPGECGRRLSVDFFSALGIAVVVIAALCLIPRVGHYIIAFLPFVSLAAFLFLNQALAEAGHAPAEKMVFPGSSKILIVLAIVFVLPDIVLALAPIFLSHELIAGFLSWPAAIAAVLLLILSASVLLVLRKPGSSLSLRSMYLPGSILLATGYLLFVYRPAGGIPLSFVLASKCCLLFFVGIMLWRIAETSGGNPMHAMAMGGTAVYIGAAAGAALAWAVQSFPAFDYYRWEIRLAIAFAVIVISFVVLLLFLPKVDKLIVFEEARERETASDLQSRCRTLVKTLGLSPREAEVMELIAQGRNVPYIADQLVVAKSTVRTHVKHIYEKAGVSSRQDLIDLLNK